LEDEMKGIELKSGWHRAGALALGAGALFVTVGCGTPAVTTVAGQERGGLAGLPVMVTCEPHQRTLVRPVVVNGAAVSQVECVAAGVAPVNGQAVAAAAAQTQAFRQLSAASEPVYETDDARIVRTSYPEPRAVQTRDVVYREPVRKTRSVKKSAIIIGSSAGVGAGVGAAVGGKKGALIGAAIGGGSAAIWDQVTRRK
jgi:hypothetical protein